MIQIPDPLDDEFPLGDGTASQATFAACPYCGEEVEILVDPGGGTEQEYVEDCEVCCRPWTVRLRFIGPDPVVELSTEDD